jgi:hypothetical protein
MCLLLAGGLGCAARLTPGESIPQVLRHYDVVVEGQDSTAKALIQAFRRRGFTVRDHIRGGGGPVAAYLVTPYRSDAGARLAVQLSDTRRGRTLAAADFSADSMRILPVQDRAERIVRELLTAASQPRIP